MTVERIDSERCNGCGICVNSCSVDVLRLDTAAAGKDDNPPCRTACPAGVDMRRYIHFLREGMMDEALEVLREELPLPAVTGRICPHPCETECARKEIDEAVNINSLERFLADKYLKEEAKPVRRIYAARVAVAGSGPAGLAAAWQLVKMGYPVTVFEASSRPGGMLRAGIPRYRLPEEVLDEQIGYIRKLGVEIKTGVAIGRDVTLSHLREEGFQAVFLAPGAQLSRRLDIPGADLEGVFGGLDYLRQVNSGSLSAFSGRVVVIGGGNVALDAALTALRLGASEVKLACLESGEEMPAYAEEIQQALEEGIEILCSWGPLSIAAAGSRVNGLELVKCTGVTDRQGKFNPVYDFSVTRRLEADHVILAVGQALDLSMVPEGIKTGAGGAIEVDPLTLETSKQGVFAGGDAAGTPAGSPAGAPASAVQAMAAGKRAAVSIDRYLTGLDLRLARPEKRGRVSKPPLEKIERLPRQAAAMVPASLRSRSFREVKAALSEDNMILEARRCTTCGSRAVIRYPDECMACDSCEQNCPQDAIYVSPERGAPLMVGWR
jgi:NADPH-dependent glutamate synthase beta subunit-like oxidoreductase/Pyruvate/2-oxoacid:ferredoxin oxidoreductase delta subunit